MAAVLALDRLSLEDQCELTRRFTYYGKSVHKGIETFGEPVLGFLINREARLVALPKTAVRTIVDPSAMVASGPHVALPHLQFTGTLQETAERDQVTAMEEASEHLRTRGATLYALRTGFGKTVCSGYQIARLKYRALVMACRGTLLKQWKKELEATTNAVVEVFNGKAIKTKGAGPDVLVTTPGMLHHVPYEWLRGVGTLILDEAVDFCTPGRLPSVLAVHPLYTIACTATPTRPDGLHSILKDLVGEPYVTRNNILPFRVTKLLTGYKPRVVLNAEGTTDWTCTLYDLVFSSVRNYCLVSTVMEAVTQGHKVLILTEYTGHVDLLMLLFQDAGIDATRFDGGLKSYTNAQVLVGSTKKVGIGFDEKSHCDNFNGVRIDTMVLATTTKQDTVLQQYAGRVVGRAESPAVVHMVDDSRNLKENHWKVAEAWYTANLGTITAQQWKAVVPDAWAARHRTAALQVLERLLAARTVDGELVPKAVNKFLLWLRNNI